NDGRATGIWRAVKEIQVSIPDKNSTIRRRSSQDRSTIFCIMLAAAIAAKIYLLTGGIIHIHQMRGITAIRKFRIFLRQVIKTVLRTTITIEQTSPMNERRQAACRIGFIRCLRILIALISYTAVLVS